MKRARLVSSVVVAAWLAAVIPSAFAEKAPDLGKTKLKDIAKYLSLSAEQQEKIRNNVERIQALVKQADKQRGGTGSGPRIPLGGSGVLSPPGPGSSGGTTGNVAEMRLQREEWQKEINNRVDEIKTVLTPPQLEKFKSIQIPDLLARR